MLKLAHSEMIIYISTWVHSHEHYMNSYANHVWKPCPCRIGFVRQFAPQRLHSSQKYKEKQREVNLLH